MWHITTGIAGVGIVGVGRNNGCQNSGMYGCASGLCHTCKCSTPDALQRRGPAVTGPSFSSVCRRIDYHSSPCDSQQRHGRRRCWGSDVYAAAAATGKKHLALTAAACLSIYMSDVSNTPSTVRTMLDAAMWSPESVSWRPPLPPGIFIRRKITQGCAFSGLNLILNPLFIPKIVKFGPKTHWT